MKNLLFSFVMLLAFSLSAQDMVVRGTRTVADVVKVTRAESTAAPTVHHDVSMGVEVGTQWDVVSNGLVTTKYICTDATNGAAVWKQIAEDNVNKTTFVIDENVTFAGDAFKALTATIPARAVIREVQMNWNTALVLSTATKIGLGTASDPDNYALSAATVTKNLKTEATVTLAVVASTTTVRVSAVDNSGAAAGSVTSGTVRVRITYDLYDQIPDAP